MDFFSMCPTRRSYARLFIFIWIFTYIFIWHSRACPLGVMISPLFFSMCILYVSFAF